jgi:hypothetical protein
MSLGVMCLAVAEGLLHCCYTNTNNSAVTLHYMALMRGCCCHCCCRFTGPQG